MARTSRKAVTGKTPARSESRVEVCEIEVVLVDTNPRIWRRFVVHSDASLGALHVVVQVVMGWEDDHLHEFADRNKVRYGPYGPDSDPPWGDKVFDEDEVRLGDVMFRKGSWLIYTYDFGDDWIHKLTLCGKHPAEPGVKYPCCLAGEGACPPEDVGGVWGYWEMLEALTDPEHDEHYTALERLGKKYDPRKFDVNKVNRTLARIR